MNQLKLEAVHHLQWPYLRWYECSQEPITFISIIHAKHAEIGQELNLPGFCLSSTFSFTLFSFNITQFSLRELSSSLLFLGHCWQSNLVSLDWHMKHMSFMWLQSLNWLASILPLHTQVSHDAWSSVTLLLWPPEHMVHSKPSLKFSLHLTQEIVPLSNSLHEAEEMFLRHDAQWDCSFSVKTTALRENKNVWMSV